MFKKLFRPKWEHARSAVRIEAIRGFDEANAEHQQLLTRLATQDSEPAVRREAVARLRDLELLASIQRRDLEAPVRDTALERTLQLLAGKHALSPELPERLARVRTLQSPQMLATLIRDGEPVELKQAAVEQLNDELYLEEIALRSPIARLRVAAAEKLTLPEILRLVEKETKGHDKAVWRIVHDKLAELGQEHKEREAEERRREEIVEAMETHARSAMAPLYRPRRDALVEQWRALAAEATPAQAERLETALMLCDQRIEEQAAIERAAAEQAEAADELQATLDTFEQVRAELRSTADYDRPSLAAVLRIQGLRWEAASALCTPTADQQRRYQTLADDLSALLTALDHLDNLTADLAAAVAADDAARWQSLTATVAWPTDFPAPAVLRERPRGTTPAVDTPPAAKQAADVRAVLAELERAIEAGQLRDVQHQLRRARDMVRTAGVSHDAAWHTLEARAKELVDWASYAVLPRKEALVGDMNALAANPAGDPEAQADKVKALREAWKALGQVGQAEEQELRDRFEAAAELAYAPCRAHFAALAEQRQENLRRRESICDELEQATAAATSWEILEGALKHARQAWRGTNPVDRDQAKPVQERFDRLNRATEARISELDHQIRAAKEELIARADALRASSDARAACEEAKQLQTAWKTVGLARPGTERSLWKRFRAACDALFAVREQQYQERRQARESVLAEADGLLAALTALAQDETSPPEQLHPQLAELDRQFNALRLPKPVLHERRDQWRRELVAARRKLDEQGSRRRDQAFAELAAQLVALAAGEQSVIGAEDAPWLPALRTRLDQDSTLSAAARQHAEETEAEAKAQACLWLEILSDSPSPEACSRQRMQLQMDRLARRGNEAAGPRDAQAAWQEYARLHAPATVCAALDARAVACLRRLYGDRRL